MEIYVRCNKCGEVFYVKFGWFEKFDPQEMYELECPHCGESSKYSDFVDCPNCGKYTGVAFSWKGVSRSLIKYGGNPKKWGKAILKWFEVDGTTTAPLPCSVCGSLNVKCFRCKTVFSVRGTEDEYECPHCHATMIHR